MSSDRSSVKHLWVVGLRRSGTTAIWKMFRGVPGFTCYDEPFNPKLISHLPEQHRKGTWDEFIDLWRTDYTVFIDKLATIDLADEMTPQVSTRDLEYINYLAQKQTIIDFTRLNFKMHNVLPKFPDAVALYLFRSPIAFATSHLINSENQKFLRQRYYRTMFFSSMLGFDSWGLETNIRSIGFLDLMTTCGVTPLKPLKKLTSAEKLLMLWITARRYSQKIIEEDKTGRIFVASYEDIIDRKCQSFEKVNQLLGIERDSLITTHLRSYSLGHHHMDPIWSKIAANAGFSDIEIDNYLRRTDK